MVNGSHYDGSVTITNIMSNRYAVVGEAYNGKYKKPQTPEAKEGRKRWWIARKELAKNARN